MASSGQTIITGIEFGTDKICVIHGRPDQNGNIEVLSFASQPSRNSVVKGTVVDQNAALNILKSVLDESEKGLGRFSRAEQQVYFLVNGIHVSARFGEGTVLNYNEDKKITASHVQKAIESAKNLAVSTDLVNIQVYDSSFLLDGTKRTFNPIGCLAEKLTAVIHIVFADKKRIDMVQTILRELGFESGYPIFVPFADAYGVLTQDERNQGTLLLDYGAGVCSYLLLYKEGVLLSGSIPVGVNNVANDLSVALELPYEYCQKFLRESKLETLRGEGKNYVEYKVSSGGAEKIRRIPLDSFEKVIDLRQREIFNLLKKELERTGMISYLRNGAVMTGGGSLIESAPATMANVMNVPVRCGEAMNVTGALSAFRSPMPCYSAILGLVKHAAALEEDSPASGNGLGRTMVHATDQFLQGLKNLGKALKI
ncbi:MAG: cell division protein FtsA [Lentisphaeria bacterium]|nr:cell division protein FtsA [Lentisphaeria bacterium]